MTRTVTIADVAAVARVSKTTVSRVLNGKGDLDASTAERVRSVIAELGYVPSARAVGLARGRSRVIALLVPSLAWPWMGEVLQGVVDAVESAGYGLLLFTCTRGEVSMRQFASQVSSDAFDGLLVIEPEGTVDYLAELHARGLPVVLIDDRGRHPEFSSVCTTNAEGGRAAARHLRELGRRRPLVITGHPHFGCTVERRTGFEAAWRDGGHALPAELVVAGDFTFGCGQAAVRAALSSGVAFDAVFAHNDLSAAGAMRAVVEAGLEVPRDVSVVGFDDVPLASQTHPALTTVHQPMRGMGATAAQLLIGHLDGVPLPAGATVLNTHLVVRGSSTLLRSVRTAVT